MGSLSSFWKLILSLFLVPKLRSVARNEWKKHPCIFFYFLFKCSKNQNEPHTFSFWADWAVLDSNEEISILQFSATFEGDFFIFSWTKTLRFYLFFHVHLFLNNKIKQLLTQPNFFNTWPYFFHPIQIQYSGSAVFRIFLDFKISRYCEVYCFWGIWGPFKA